MNGSCRGCLIIKINKVALLTTLLGDVTIILEYFELVY